MGEPPPGKKLRVQKRKLDASLCKHPSLAFRVLRVMWNFCVGFEMDGNQGVGVHYIPTGVLGEFSIGHASSNIVSERAPFYLRNDKTIVFIIQWWKMKGKRVNE